MLTCRPYRSSWHILVISFVFLCCNSYSIFAQEKTAVIHQLQVFEVYTTVNEDFGHDDEFRWKLRLNDRYQGCIEVNGDNGHHDRYMNILTDPRLDVTQPLVFNLETWENDGGSSCVYDSDDEAHCGPTDFYLRLADYEPGMPHVFEMAPCSRFKLWLRFRYGVPTPRNVTVSPSNGGNICDERPTITLQSEAFIKPEYLPNTTFVWKYRSNGSPVPRELGRTTGSATYSFNNIRDLRFIYQQANDDVTFSVELIYRTSDGSILYSESTPRSGTTIHLSPVRPDVSGISTFPTCYGKDTGTINGYVSGSFSSYKYVLRPLGNTTPCNPDIRGDCGGDASGTIIMGSGTSGYFSIENVRKGDYTLVITNPGSTSGVCYSTRTVTINELPSLQLTVGGIDAVSCQGGSDGAIRLSATGGKLPYGNYSLSKAGGFFSTSSTGEFTGLTTGTYIASIVDACNQSGPSTIATVAVPEPVRVHAAVTVASPTCNSPANGAVEVIVNQGQGEYLFKILQDNTILAEENSSAVNWSIDDLTDGTYTVEIRDALRLQCDGFTEQIILSAPESFELGLSDAVKTDVDCYGRSNGSITLSGVDLSGDYKYSLQASGQTEPRVLTTTPTFADLGAGRYTLVMQRTIDGCNDRAEYPALLEIAQPEQPVITLDKRDISCHGETDGAIMASVAGATSSDRYTWEVQVGDAWASLNHSATAFYSLEAGTYRMRLTNDHSCMATAQEVTVVEPAVLSISNASAHDVVCFGEKGEITTVLQGGVTPYVYEYTSATGEVVNVSSSVALLDQGVYTLRGRDANGCLVNYAAVLTITAPDVPLTMSLLPSDYNGFNISCTGASDGYVNIDARGGNGDGYSGYEYSLDGQAFQAGSDLANIAAGSHTASVRDARGCIIHSDILMTAPLSFLQARLIGKKDVQCAGDEDGFVSIDAQGGIAPYTYTMAGESQAEGTFSSLPSGGYTILITDRNHCELEYATSIDVLTPPMDVQLQHTDVACYGGNDGAAQALVTGGMPPLKYAWRGLLAETSSLSSLVAGIYNFAVTDQAGCVQQRELIVREPDQLTVRANTFSVCPAKVNGEIRLKAEGGTPAYRYSVDDGTNYQDEPFFMVAASTYRVRVRDEHRCEIALQVEVTTSRKALPDPDFIVAMTQQASDTLMIREISVPQPDSVLWTFDPAITVLSDHDGSPLVTVSEPGNYDITMRGFFDGCDYEKTLTLTISPFDEEVKVIDKLPIRIIKTLQVVPNSSDGRFEIKVEMETKQRLSVGIYDMLGVPHFRQHWDKTTGISVPVDISATVAPGIYVVRAVAETDAMETRLVVVR